MPWIAAGGAVLGGMLAKKGSKQQNVTQTNAPWAGQQPYLSDLFGRSQNWLNTQSGFNPLQQQGQQMALGYADQLPGILGNAQSGWQFGLNPLANPYLQGAAGTYDALRSMMSATPDMSIWGPVMDAAQRRPIQAFNEQVLPGIRSGAIGSGQYGGSRQGIAEGIAMRGLGDTLGDIQTNLANQAANQALQQRTAGAGIGAGLLSGAYGTTAGLLSNSLGQSSNMAGLGLLPSTIYQGVGGQQQQLPLQNLSAYQQLIGGGYGGQQTTPYFSNPALSTLGGGLMGYQLGGLLGGGRGSGANNLGDMGMGLLGGGMMGGGMM